MTGPDRLAPLIEDREHGASEITEHALEAYLDIANQAHDPLEALADAGARLIQAHPAMAPLVNATSAALEAVNEEGPQGLHRVIAARRQRRQEVRSHAIHHVPERGALTTYSRSGTVLEALLHAHEQGARFRVLLSEARPRDEGLAVAPELARRDIPVTVTFDAALPSLGAETDVVMVGADSLCQAGIVNKIGTGSLARAARSAGTPVLAVGSLEKALPSSYRRRPALTARGKLEHDLPGVQAAAPLFECVPYELFDAVVTEEGSLGTEDVQRHLEGRGISKLLLERL